MSLSRSYVRPCLNAFSSCTFLGLLLRLWSLSRLSVSVMTLSMESSLELCLVTSYLVSCWTPSELWEISRLSCRGIRRISVTFVILTERLCRKGGFLLRIISMESISCGIMSSSFTIWIRRALLIIQVWSILLPTSTIDRTRTCRFIGCRWLFRSSSIARASYKSWTKLLTRRWSSWLLVLVKSSSLWSSSKSWLQVDDASIIYDSNY